MWCYFLREVSVVTSSPLKHWRPPHSPLFYSLSLCIHQTKSSGGDDVPLHLGSPSRYGGSYRSQILQRDSTSKNGSIGTTSELSIEPQNLHTHLGNMLLKLSAKKARH